ncbi:proteasome assembly chaperone 1 [Microcaecilia unicolor]|uniref:Proteasome assembly chaperone 1 n=1 Tax=Microcaecilia unicolor TaxID=1415580 RepID=A0A6P7YCP1_9AMPH|nr:proteasome assembly chaperone 1 [Microcaecilia unicolor]
MATFFGEVLPVFSRAVDDDDDEELEEENEDLEIRKEIEKKREVHLHWRSDISAVLDRYPGKRLPCTHFILAVGENATGFLSSFVLSSGSWEVAGDIKLWNEICRESTSSNVLHSSAASCVFYQLTSCPTVILCQCHCYVAEDQQFHWPEKVFSSIQQSGLTVTILSTCPVTFYKTPESTYTLRSPFLRALKTKEFKEDMTLCPLMEPPNIVDGFPAAVLSYCQVWKIPAVLYQCYTDLLKLDPVTMEAFRPLLLSQSLRNVVVDSSKSTEAMKKLMKTTEIQSNLYI